MESMKLTGFTEVRNLADEEGNFETVAMFRDYISSYK